MRLDAYNQFSNWFDFTGLFREAERPAPPSDVAVPVLPAVRPTPTVGPVPAQPVAAPAALDAVEAVWLAPIPGGALPVAFGPKGTDNLYVSTPDGVVYLLNGGDGKQIWSLDLGVVSEAVTAADRRLYVIADSKALVAIDHGGDRRPWTPTVLWRQELDQGGSLLAIGDNNELYTVSGNGIVERRSTDDGRPLWRVDLQGPVIKAPPAVGPDGTVYVGSAEPGDVYAVSRDGQVLWMRDTGPVAVSPAIGSLYVATQDEVLYAFERDGTLRWRRDDLAPASAPPAIATDGSIYLLALKELFSFSPDGALQWTAEFDRALRPGMVLFPDGTAFVLSYDGTLSSVAPDGSVTELLRDERFRWLLDRLDDMVYVGGDDGVAAFGVVELSVIAAARAAVAAPAPQPIPTVAPVAFPTPAPTATAAPAPRPTATPAAAATPAPGTPRYGGVLRLALQRDPFSDGFSPYANFSGVKAQVNSLIFSRLFRKDNNSFELVGDLAEAWEVTADGRIWTIRLRGDARFHDGSPVTATDVQQSMQAMLESTGFVFQELREAVNDIVVVDDLTVVIFLREPFAPFLDVLASAWAPIVPARFLNDGVEWSAERLVGSGPFRVGEYRPGEVLVVDRDPGYFRQALPYVDRVEFFFVSDRATQLAAFRTGKLDFAGASTGSGLDSSELEEIRRSESAVLFEGWAVAPALRFDTQNPPFNDARVRRAVALSIDRPLWDAELNNGRGRLEFPIPSLYFPEWAHPESAVKEVLAYDPDQAKRLLVEAGFPDGLQTVLYVWAERYMLGAELIADMLSRVGIEVELRHEERAALRERLLSEEGYQGMFYGGASGVNLDIDGFLAANFLPVVSETSAELTTQISRSCSGPSALSRTRGSEGRWWPSCSGTASRRRPTWSPCPPRGKSRPTARDSRDSASSRVWTWAPCWSGSG